ECFLYSDCLLERQPRLSSAFQYYTLLFGCLTRRTQERLIQLLLLDVFFAGDLTRPEGNHLTLQLNHMFMNSLLQFLERLFVKRVVKRLSRVCLDFRSCSGGPSQELIGLIQTIQGCCYGCGDCQEVADRR